MPTVLQNSLVMPTAHRSNGARLVASDGKTLPLQGITLTSEAAGGIARTTLRQHFTNPYPNPLELTYVFPLPVDGAVAGYEIRAGDRVIKGRIEPKDDARAQFEEARLEGRTAGLVEEERPNFFTQRLGNIPASTDVFVDLTIDHRLRWIPGGEWEWRFPIVVAPRYLGAEGTVADAGRVTIDVADGPTRPTASVTLSITDLDDPDILAWGPSSSTHQIVVEGFTVSLAADAALDRDIVIRWEAARSTPGCQLKRSRLAIEKPGDAAAAYGLLTIVPPASTRRAVARDLVLLLDVSGSMQGTPLSHLKSIVTSLIDGLGDEDRLEMVAFASSQVRYKSRPIATTSDERRKACVWVEKLEADGGTEMISAIEEALRPMRDDATRQVVVITDGLIGFESAAIRSIRDGLPRACRLHTVGLGSASNRAFLRPAARAGRGIEVLIDLDDPAGPAAERIAAATREPVVIDVSVRGDALVDTAPRLPDLLASSPVLSALRLHPAGGSLVVSGRTAGGTWEQTINVPATEAGEGAHAIPALWARETIEDLELDLACGAGRSEIDRRIEAIALQHSVLSRLTSWIAISEVPTVDPREPVRVERIPQSLPYGMSPDGLGLRMRDSMVMSAMAALPEPLARMRIDMRESLEDHASYHEESALGRITKAIAKFIARLKKRRPISVPPIELRGRIVPTPGRPATTIEFIVTSALEWQPATEATVGTRKVQVVKQKTTKPGEVAPGSLVRVTLVLPAEEIAKAGFVGIECGTNVLVITIEEPD